jgi:3-methyl-2-oxobutanoate hydroxymethyltransferase
LKADALTLQAAGASLLVLEAIPSALGKEVTELLAIPTIGIGAGPDCSGQVLVMHDMLGVFPGRKARFVKNFMEGQASIEAAVRTYISAVKDGSFPANEHCF